MFGNFFSENRAMNEKRGNVLQSQIGHRWQSMAHAHCVLDNYGCRDTKYVILIAFPRQKLFRERVSMLRLYVHYCNVYFCARH